MLDCWHIDRVVDPGEAMRKLVLLVALGCALTACSPDEPAPTTSPTPSVTATPSANPSTDPLYLEAVEVYKAYYADISVLEAKGYPEPALPPRFDRYITGSMKEAVTDLVRQGHGSGLKLKGEKPATLTAIAPNPGVRQEDSLVSLRTCSDGSNSIIIDSTGKEVGTGALVYREVFFKRFGKNLKAFLSDAREVSKCPIP